MKFRLKKITPDKTPLAFRTRFRGYSTYGPIYLTFNIPPGRRNRDNLQDGVQWFLWYIDSTVKNWWALCDNGTNIITDNSDGSYTINAVLMFGDRNDALMYKLGKKIPPLE